MHDAASPAPCCVVRSLADGACPAWRFPDGAPPAAVCAAVAPLPPGAVLFAPVCVPFYSERGASLRRSLEALALHGPFRGSWLALRRLGRCHPWGGHGHDPVPAARHDHSPRAGDDCPRHHAPTGSQPS